MRVLLNVSVFVLCFALNGWTDLTMEVLDVEKRAVRLVYEIADDKEGHEGTVFPQGGFIHDATAGQFRVESVVDVSNNLELDYQVLLDKKTDAPFLQIPYKFPIPKDGKKVLRITVKVNLPKRLMGIDKSGKIYYACETSHRFQFVIPKDQYIVYSNHPVTLAENNGQVIVTQTADQYRTIMIQTRAMKKD